jgi:hypothetical protein
LALFSFIWFTLIFARFSFGRGGRDAALDMHPVRRLWYVMVP